MGRGKEERDNVGGSERLMQRSSRATLDVNAGVVVAKVLWLYEALPSHTPLSLSLLSLIKGASVHSGCRLSFEGRDMPLVYQRQDTEEL